MQTRPQQYLVGAVVMGGWLDQGRSSEPGWGRAPPLLWHIRHKPAQLPREDGPPRMAFLT